MRLETSNKHYYGLFDYNPKHIYEVGDIVIYEELAYRCHNDMSREDLGKLPTDTLFFRPLHDLPGHDSTMVNTFEDYLTLNRYDERPLNAGILKQVINHHSRIGDSLDVSSVDLNLITNPGIYRNPKFPINLVERPVGATCYLRVLEGDDMVITQEVIADEYICIRSSDGPVVGRVAAVWKPWKIIHLTDTSTTPVSGRVNNMINSMIDLSHLLEDTVNNMQVKDKGFKITNDISSVDNDDMITIIYMDGHTQKFITGIRKDITTIPTDIKKILVYG